MRTTLDIPDDLMERARRAASLHSKRDTVLAGLTELIRKAEREQLRAMAGKVDLRVDLKRSRTGKRERRPRRLLGLDRLLSRADRK
jgi:Arc/MetJ family transcription regulator